MSVGNLLLILVFYSCDATITFKNCPSQKLTANFSVEGSSAYGPNNEITVLFAGGAPNTYTNVNGFHVTSSSIESFHTSDVTNRDNMAFTSWNNLIIFAGGSINGSGSGVSSRVDIYNTATAKWSLKYLSESRDFLAAASVGNITMFAGGENEINHTKGASDVVDIWNHTDDSWSTATLSLARKKLAAASAGNKILFAGGFSENPQQESDVVDVWDMNTNVWNTAKLSQPRQRLGGASATPNIACFGGGEPYSDHVDIYNDDNGEWSVMIMSEARRNLYGQNVNNRYCVFGGGIGTVNNSLFTSDKLDVYDGVNNEIAATQMESGPRSYPGMAGAFNMVMVAGGGSGDIVDVIAINGECVNQGKQN
eukprot:472012_1